MNSISGGAGAFYAFMLMAFLLQGCAAFTNSTTVRVDRADLGQQKAIDLCQVYQSVAGKRAESLELRFVEGEHVAIYDRDVTGRDPGATYTLRFEPNRLRAWVVDQSANRVVLSADHETGRAWTDETEQPPWAKLE
jgi:hypothetical protein